MTVQSWPETAPIWAIWGKVANQWRAGGGGAFALDYNTLFYVMDRMRLSAEEHEELFEDIRVIEAEVLAIWSEQREAEEEEAKRKNR